MMSLVVLPALFAAVSVDCPNVINLAIGLNINVHPSIMTALHSDCCSESGITCDGARVTEINWSNMGLTGYINGSALPSQLESLVLNNQQLTGVFPNPLPATLQVLHISTNQISGLLPATLPLGLQNLQVQDNLLTGNLTSTNWGLCTSLNDAEFYKNKFTGTIPNNWPASITLLTFGSNQFTGTIPNNLPSALTFLAAEFNQLTGDVPVLPSTLLELFLNNNKLTGTLRLNAPTFLDISFNWITDVVVRNSTALTTCDISNNPLLGNPNINNLGMCVQNGLYSADSLPITVSSVTKISKAFTKQIFFSSISKTKLVISTATKVEQTTLHTLFIRHRQIPRVISTTLVMQWNATTVSTVSNYYPKTDTLGNGQPNSNSPNLTSGSLIIYILLATIAIIAVLLLISKRFIKHPKIHSKFGRKNSFGTLNTVNTVNTRK